MDHGKLTDHNGKADRLPQRDPDHDHECGRGRHGARGLRLHALEAPGGRRPRGDQQAVHPRVQEPPRCDRARSATVAGGGDLQGGRQVHPAARGAARRPQRDGRADRRGASNGWSNTATTRRMGAQAHGPRDPAQAIKTPLADEVLFGKLKNGGAVRVVVVADDGGHQDARLRLSGRPRAAEARARHRRGRQEAGSEEPGPGPRPKRSEPDAATTRTGTSRPRTTPSGGGSGTSVPKVPLKTVGKSAKGPASSQAAAPLLTSRDLQCLSQQDVVAALAGVAGPDGTHAAAAIGRPRRDRRARGPGLRDRSRSIGSRPGGRGRADAGQRSSAAVRAHSRRR